MQNYKIDEVDLKILKLLQSNGRLSKAKIAQSVHLSEVPCWRRVRHLEDCGFISSYVALINREMLGYSFAAFVHLEVDTVAEGAHRDFRDTISRYPEVLGFYNVAGDFNYVLFVVTKDVQGFRQFLDDRLRCLVSIKRMNTSVVLDTIKCENNIDLQ